MLKELKPAILITFVLTIITGILYPLAVTGLAQTLFHKQANGSLIERDGKVIGSVIIGPTNPALADRLTKDAAQFRKDNPDYAGDIPADAITTSASGLDPEISPANALSQAARVAKARGASVDAVVNLVTANIQRRDLAVLGEPRVNVLKLNLALDQEYAGKK
jgi:K+-transporting ATPase ATPase C chain